MIPARGEQGFQILPNGKKPTMHGLGNLVDSAMGNKQNLLVFHFDRHNEGFISRVFKSQATELSLNWES